MNGTQRRALVNAWYEQRYGKRHLLGWKNIEIDPLALTIVELCLSEGIRLLVGQSVENFIYILKFRRSILGRSESLTNTGHILENCDRFLDLIRGLPHTLL